MMIYIVCHCSVKIYAQVCFELEKYFCRGNKKLREIQTENVFELKKQSIKSCNTNGGRKNAGVHLQISFIMTRVSNSSICKCHEWKWLLQLDLKQEIFKIITPNHNFYKAESTYFKIDSTMWEKINVATWQK